jgi:hypothetical protein
MTRAGSGKPLQITRSLGLRRSTIVRRVAIVLAFFALAIQSLVVQPHIHAQPSGTALAMDISSSDGGPTDSHDPLEQAQPDCPVCQSAHQNGQYLRPSAATFALPAFVNYRGVEFSRLPAALEAVSHSWQGRAPPQA